MKHVIGRVYYRVEYLDVKMKYPLVQSYVHIGFNLSEEDVNDTWYFQDLVNYHKQGSALEAAEPGTPVVCLQLEELEYDMFDLDALHSALLTAQQRS